MIRRLSFMKVSAGLLEPRHVQAIGGALWEFLLLIHLQDGDDGVVNGGSPIRASEIAEQLGLPLRTVERHLVQLRPYLETKRTPYGLTFRILKPSKFQRSPKNGGSGIPKYGGSGSPKNGGSLERDYPKSVERSPKNGGCNIKQTQTKTLSLKKVNGQFELWWSTLPRRVGKPKARTAYLKIILEGKPGPNRLTDLDEFQSLATFEQRHGRLMQTTPVVAADWRKREERYIPHPATFLNSGDWLTSPEPVRADDGFKKSWED